MNYELPYFEALDPEALKARYDVVIPFEGRPLRIDLNFENAKIGIEALDLVKRHLGDLGAFHRRNKALIQDDYARGTEVKYYITEHLARPDDEVAAILKNAVQSMSKELQMLESFYLKRLGFYPHARAAVVSDYTVNEEWIDDLVVIFAQLDGTLECIAIES